MATDRGYPWLKVYPILLDDHRFSRRSDGAKALYIESYLLAGKADAGGLVAIGNDIATPETLAYILRRDPETIAALIDELVTATLFTRTPEGISITRFQDEQGPAHAEKREAWRTRQAAKRDKYKALALEKEKEEEEEQTRQEVSNDSRVTIPPGNDGNQAQELLSLFSTFKDKGTPSGIEAAFFISLAKQTSNAKVAAFLKFHDAKTWNHCYNIAKKNPQVIKDWQIKPDTGGHYTPFNKSAAGPDGRVFDNGLPGKPDPQTMTPEERKAYWTGGEHGEYVNT